MSAVFCARFRGQLGVTEEVEVELARPPDPTYEDEYRVKVIGEPGEMLEASVHRGDGEQLLHTFVRNGLSLTITVLNIPRTSQQLFR